MATIIDAPKTENFSLSSARKLVEVARDKETLIILHNVSWKNYEQLMTDRELAGRRSPRFDYNQGTLWIDPKAAPENCVGLATVKEAIAISVQEKSSIVLHHISWKTYEEILRDRDGSYNPRFYFHQQRLLIMPTSLEHEAIIFFLELFINFVTVEWNIDCTGFRSATFRRSDIKEGFEPDSCFYFNENEAKMFGKKRFDEDNDPAPDLIVEVDITSSSEIREETFAAFKIPELWRFDGEKVKVLKLDGGKYISIENSLILPLVSSKKITEFVLNDENLNRLAWIKKVQQWARDVQTN